MYDTALTNGNSCSLWYSNLAARDVSALEGSELEETADLAVDVAIVGAGISGLSVAYHLCKQGRLVAVFDKARIGAGETGRTTAHLASGLDDRDYALEHLHGEAGAQLAAASHVAAIADIERIVREEQIECAFTRVPGYLVSVRPGDAGTRELIREHDAAKRAGLDVELMQAGDFAWTRRPHLVFAQQAQFEPLAYLAGLARAIVKMGGRIYTGARVHAVDTLASPIVIHLSPSQRVQARDVVIATNTPIIDRFAMHTKQAPYRSYVLAFQVSSPMPPALLWDTGDPYHYVRLAGDNDIMIVGGEDHKVGQARDTEEHWHRLESWTRSQFPNLGSVKARWSGQILEPVDGVAYIGRNPGISAHVYIVTGDSGNGMTHGAIAGLLLSELIAGRTSPWAHLYDPARKPKRGALTEFVKENVNVALHATTGYVGPKATPADIAPGTGRVVRRGARQVALYIAEDGQTHAHSAVCPHLGCVVQWNNAEKSWDCPCHGSRFDPFGHVLTGPAMRDLTALDPPRGANGQSNMHKDLLQHLSHELWQTEVSASQHCRREAERLGDTPPARAMIAAAEHADSVLKRLPELSTGRPLSQSGVGMAVGKFFSEMRDTVADKLLTSERSYRGTILGLRHGIDLVQLMRATAEECGDSELVTFFDQWLAQRVPLVDDIAAQLKWFAARPDEAMKQARGLFAAKRMRVSDRV